MQAYRVGADQEAPAWLTNQAAPNAVADSNTNTAQLAAPELAVNLNMGTLVGSYESIARMPDEVAAVEGTAGVLLVFDDFLKGVEDFGTNPAADDVQESVLGLGTAACRHADDLARRCSLVCAPRSL